MKNLGKHQRMAATHLESIFQYYKN